MSIVDQLSSQVGDRTQDSNLAVVARCLEDPALLAQVVDGLHGKQPALLGDCAEVMTKVAEQRPELVAPYTDALSPLLTHRTTRVRWEAMHALALVAALVPEQIFALMPQLTKTIRNDTSIIVRDYAVDALGNVAKASSQAALQAYPALKEAVYAWDSRHVGRALSGLCNVVVGAPTLASEVIPIGHEFADHSKGTVRKAAKALLKATAKAQT